MGANCSTVNKSVITFNSQAYINEIATVRFLNLITRSPKMYLVNILMQQRGMPQHNRGLMQDIDIWA